MSGLLHFSERPQAEDTTRSYPILRCDSEQKYRLSGFILSAKIFGVNVHFIGKSVPCSAPHAPCTWCDAGRPIRWVGYAPACDISRHKLFLFEFTPGVMPSFEQYLRQHGSYRGCFVNLSRRKPRPTARLEVGLEPAGKFMASGDLPPAFDCEKVLEKIYGLTEDQQKSTVKESVSLPSAELAERRTEAAVANPLSITPEFIEDIEGPNDGYDDLDELDPDD